MTLSKKQIFLVILVGVFIFFTGLVIGFLLRNGILKAMNSDEEHIEKRTYKCTAIVYISKDASDQTSFSSADLEEEAFEIASVLEGDMLIENVKKKIDVQHPDIAYNVELEQIVESTQVYYVIVTGDSKEQLQEICDLATSLLCEEIEFTMSGVQCKILEKANTPGHN